MCFERLRHHAKYPVWVDFEAREEVDECKRVKEALIGTRKEEAEAVEDRRQELCAVKVKWTGAVCVAALALAHELDDRLKALIAELLGCADRTSEKGRRMSVAGYAWAKAGVYRSPVLR